ncbi:MAG: arginine--tRNA ligase, partial [Patescibacteria group bacterium]
GYKAYEEDETAKKEIIDLNKKIYERVKGDIYNIYIEGKEHSLKNFELIYKRLNNHFDFHFYESEAGEMGKKIVLENVGKVFEESDGAVIFRGENFEPKTHTRVFLNSDGLPTYEAKEVGLAQIKKEIWPYDCSITITANEQDAFFDVVEVAIGKVFPNLKGKLKHLSHGMLKLPTGKMSSRTGDVITAEALISQVKEKVLEKIKDRNFDNTEKENVAEVVAIGAIKYSILRQAIGGNIIFDFNKSISFEGDSGPYLQYTYTRAHAVLEKAKMSRILLDNQNVLNLQQREVSRTPLDIERVLYRFPEVVEKAGMEFAPHIIVTYLIELSSLFNSFYAKEKIIDKNDLASSYKIALTSAVAQVLKNGLRLLGIKTLEKM